MEHCKIVSISHRTYLPDLEDILDTARDKLFKYEFVPVVLHNEKEKGMTKIVEKPPRYLPKPLILYEGEVHLESLLKYIGGSAKKEDLAVARRAYEKLRAFALQCSERVIADLCCQIMLDTISGDKSKQLVYFLERPASDKILGRLGYLYFNLENVTICFISYEPEDMITTVMSAKTGKLLFDLHRLLSSREEEIFTSPYPGSCEDSLLQTYFFKPRPDTIHSEFLPIRLDIFCQGLSETDIEKKANILKEIVNDVGESTGYPLRKTGQTPWVRLPIGFQKILMAWDEGMFSKRYILTQMMAMGGKDQ